MARIPALPLPTSPTHGSSTTPVHCRLISPRSLLGLFLLTLSTTAYGQTERLLLTPLGSTEQKMTRSAEKLLGTVTREESWEYDDERCVVYVPDNSVTMFGRQITGINTVFRNGRLRLFTVTLDCDSAAQARTTYEEALKYTRSRLKAASRERYGSLSPVPRRLRLYREEIWRTRSGQAAVVVEGLSDNAYVVEISHLRLE